MSKAPQNMTPRHVAIIMDGNGRWAKERGLDRSEGHFNGVESIRRVIRAAVKNNVEYLTLFAFSTENWGRPTEEVNALIELLCKCIVNETPALKEQGVKIRFIGGIEEMSSEVRSAIEISEKDTAVNSKLTLVIAVNYSARWEIIRMARLLAEEALSGKISPSQIDGEVVSDHMVTASIPDPDLLIRTSGELRLSNFLLWQLAYTELYFTPVLWPDFSEKDFDDAIIAHSKRERRFGTVARP